MDSFQKYLSYFFRIVVEKVSSIYNPELIIAIQKGKYVLNTKNANYSYASLHRVFQQALNRIEIKSSHSILILGCGAGSIPSIIYNELKLSPKIDAVEIDEKVIDLGNKYFGLNQYYNLNIIIDDALHFVKTTNNKYDLILVDLFKGINVPKEFLEQQFLEQLKNRLNNKGGVLFNFVAYNYETKKKAEHLLNTTKNVFSKVELFKLEGINKVFYLKNKST